MNKQKAKEQKSRKAEKQRQIGNFHLNNLTFLLDSQTVINLSNNILQ